MSRGMTWYLQSWYLLVESSYFWSPGLWSCDETHVLFLWLSLHVSSGQSEIGQTEVCHANISQRQICSEGKNNLFSLVTSEICHYKASLTCWGTDTAVSGRSKQCFKAISVKSGIQAFSNKLPFLNFAWMPTKVFKMSNTSMIRVLKPYSIYLFYHQ